MEEKLPLFKSCQEKSKFNVPNLLKTRELEQNQQIQFCKDEI